MKKKIEFIFSIGYRCYSPDTLKHYGLRKISGPFDYLFIDLESAFKIIDDKFENFLSDIVHIDRKKNIYCLKYKKNYSKIKKSFIPLLFNKNYYMRVNEPIDVLFINQNYTEFNTFNIYNWQNICNFHHHDLTNNETYNTLKKRCERFNYTINNFKDTTALFYITKIINNITIIDSFMENIIHIKKKYKINNYLIIIINCVNSNEYHINDSLNNILFIIKNSKSYEEFIQENCLDSDYRINGTYNKNIYDNEFKIINQYFSFNLINKYTIDKQIKI